jgi:hypothetical protein
MKATIEIANGSARIYPAGPKSGEVFAAPYSVELEGDWAVGSASAPGAAVPPAEVVVMPAEDGLVHHDLPAHDSFGKVVPSGTYEEVGLLAGVEFRFETHESNAVTVQAVAAKEPKS